MSSTNDLMYKNLKRVEAENLRLRRELSFLEKELISKTEELNALKATYKDSIYVLGNSKPIELLSDKAKEVVENKKKIKES